MKMRLFAALGLGLALLLVGLVAGCAQKATTAPLSAALEGAQRLERRAANAYSKGDLLGAQKDYQTAAAVYTSLALDMPLAAAQLNLAKIEGESGRAAEGLALAEAVLAKANLGVDSRLMGHGRAAALSLAVQKPADAQKHLDTADVLCAGSCDAASALAVLRAEVLLLGNQLAAAKSASERALQAAKTDADKANALRARASVGLAEGAPSGLAAAAVDAELALALDQNLGVSARVIADLALLAQLHRKAGNAGRADQYTAMAAAAQAAREQLRLK